MFAKSLGDKMDQKLFSDFADMRFYQSRGSGLVDPVEKDEMG